MRNRTATALAGAVFTAVIPTIVGAMIPDLDFGVGLAIVACCAVVGLALFAYVFFGGKGGIKPKKHWIPLNSAPFVLAPHKKYWSKTPFWTPILLKYSLPGKEPLFLRMTERLTQEEAKTRSGIPLDQTRILCRERKFEWTWNDDHRHFMVKYHPWSMSDGRCPDWLDSETWAKILNQSQITWDYLGRGLSDIISKGLVKVWVRMGSSTAPFSLLPANAWANFTIEDWEHGRAKGAGSDYLFDIYIEQID